MNYTKNEIIYETIDHGAKIEVVDTLYENASVSFLMVDGQMESAMYLEEDKKYDLLFPYMRHFEYAFTIRPNIKKTYLIGGGGFSYPKYYLHHHKKADITVSELSKEVISIAHQYFGLNQMNIEDYARLNIIHGDGFAKLDELEMFDWIINDAFIGKKTMGRNADDTKKIHDHLNEDGIYMVNVTGSIKGLHSFRQKLFMKQLKKYFRYTTMLICEPDRSPYEPQNLLFIASDKQV